jgi:hypothetical protein
MRSSANATAAAALLLAIELAQFSAGAQAQGLPSEADISAQMAKQRAAAVEALKMSPGQGTQAGGFKTEVPKVSPAPHRTQDLDALVKQYESGKPVDLPKSSHDLFVFVSFSMPHHILKELARQAKETGAVLAEARLEKIMRSARPGPLVRWVSQKGKTTSTIRYLSSISGRLILFPHSMTFHAPVCSENTAGVLRCQRNPRAAFTVQIR